MSDVEKALRDLVAKIDELTPGINGMFQMAALHGAVWPADQNWVAEMAAAKAALAAQQNSPSGDDPNRKQNLVQAAVDIYTTWRSNEHRHGGNVHLLMWRVFEAWEPAPSPLGGLSEGEVVRLWERTGKSDDAMYSSHPLGKIIAFARAIEAETLRRQVLLPRELNFDFGAILDQHMGPDTTWEAVYQAIALRASRGEG